MNDEVSRWRRPQPWIALVAVVIALVFLYFYKPFETYLLERIPGIHFSNVLFWFASLVGVVAYVIAHWQSFRRQVFRDGGDLDATALVFDTLQIAILVAVIFFAGAVIQGIEMLSELLMAPADSGAGAAASAGAGATAPEVGFGSRVVSIVVMVILAILFYLLHHLVGALRTGWRPRRSPPRSGGPDRARPPSPSAGGARG